MEGLAAHSRRLMQLRVPKPGMGLSYAAAVTCSPAFHLNTCLPSSVAECEGGGSGEEWAAD